MRCLRVIESFAGTDLSYPLTVTVTAASKSSFNAHCPGPPGRPAALSGPSLAHGLPQPGIRVGTLVGTRAGLRSLRVTAASTAAGASLRLLMALAKRSQEGPLMPDYTPPNAPVKISPHKFIKNYWPTRMLLFAQLTRTLRERPSIAVFSISNPSVK
jgi:hypothetical protein